eukprot:6827236-Pyramimonas_sp.AAC.2
MPFGDRAGRHAQPCRCRLRDDPKNKTNLWCGIICVGRRVPQTRPPRGPRRRSRRRRAPRGCRRRRPGSPGTHHRMNRRMRCAHVRFLAERSVVDRTSGGIQAPERRSQNKARIEGEHWSVKASTSHLTGECAMSVGLQGF